MTATLVEPLVGCEVPRLWTRPLRPLSPATSRGFEAAVFAEDVLRLRLLPWQRWLLEHMLELDDAGAFRFRTVIVQVARQSGKSTLAQVLALWRMFVDRAPLVIGTAQNLDVAEEVWSAAVDMAEATAELAAEIAAVERTNGKKALRLMSGERYRVTAASRRGPRGLSGDLVLLDEIREHRTWDAWAAVSKTTMARPRPQIVALSNAGDASSIVLNHLRDLGLKTIDGGGDPSIGLFEWSAPDGCSMDDRSGWAQANPALGHTIAEASIVAARATDPEAVFRTEVLCQRVDDMVAAVIPARRWAACAGDAAIDGPVTVAVDVALDRSRSFVAVAGRAGGMVQVELADTRAGTDWVVDRVSEIVARNEVLCVAARSAGPVASLLPELRGVAEDVGVRFEKAGSGDFSGMCGWFYDTVMTGTLRHRGDKRVADALAAARRHQVVDAWQWERTKVDVDAAPLVAVTLAGAVFHRMLDADYDVLASVY